MRNLLKNSSAGKIAIILVLLVFAVFFLLIVSDLSLNEIITEEKVEEESLITVEKSEDKIIFRFTEEGVYVPKSGLTSPPYLSGPWEIRKYNQQTDFWEEVQISDICVYPLCGDDGLQIACSVVPHPPPCEELEEIVLLEWDKKQVILNEEENCYLFEGVEKGKYKVVFHYKEEPCEKVEVESFADHTYITSVPVFAENIKKIEKIFIIE